MVANGARERVALVTGAGAGIGRATAELLIEDTAGVVPVDLEAAASTGGGRRPLRHRPGRDPRRRPVGLIHGTRAAIPALRDAPEASVVITASVSGFGTDPDTLAYNTAKAGVVNLVRTTAWDIAGDGIRVNGMAPGPVRTALTSYVETNAPRHSRPCAGRCRSGAGASRRRSPR